jgi:hypothetical protein
MKTYGGSGSITSLILNPCTTWRTVAIFTSRPLYLRGKSPWYPWDRRLGGPHSRSERGGEEKKIPSLPLHPGSRHYSCLPHFQSFTLHLTQQSSQRRNNSLITSCSLYLYRFFC